MQENDEKMRDTHAKLIELSLNPDLVKTPEQVQAIASLQQKGQAYIEKEMKSLNTSMEIKDDYTLHQYLLVGLALEKQEELKKSPAIENKEKNDELEQEIIQAKTNIGNHNQKQTLTLKPELNNKKSLENDKDKNELLEDDDTTLKSEVKPESKVAILEETIIQEITVKAKRDGELKEVTLKDSQLSENGEAPRSVVVDLSAAKIEQVINKLDEIYNPANSKLAETKKVDVTDTMNNNNKKPEGSKAVAPKPTPGLKPKPPAPKPEDNTKAQIEVTQSMATAKITATAAELAQKFRRQQEEEPIVIEEEKFDTIRTFDFRNKGDVMSRIRSMRQRSDHVHNPYAQDAYGAQDVPKKKKLLSNSGI